MALGEMSVSSELIGIILAAAALGTAILASMSGLRKDMKTLRDEVKAGEARLRDEVKAIEARLRDDMKAIEGGLRSDMKATEGGLRSDMKAIEGGLRDEVKGLRDEVTAGFKELAGRLSKVEGIIEGVFWGDRERPPREGAA